MIYNNITELIGKTPLIRLNKITQDLDIEIMAKVEYFNPGGSIKDRIALHMILDAEKKGLINKNTLLIEPTSGNTGIGLALVSAALGYNLVITMPENMSKERQSLMKAFGAKLVLTPEDKGMKGAIEKAEEINAKTQNSYILQQFKNKANPEIHMQTTAKEILEDTQGEIDIFIAGVGTGGTLTGVGNILKHKIPKVKVVAVEPANSPVLSGGKPGLHKIQGIGAGFIPEVLNTNVIDEIIKVENEDAYNWAREVVKKEGLLVGISSGAAVFAALELAKRKENIGKKIVVLLPDTGERYLSTGIFD